MSALIVENKGPVKYIRLNRPEVRNAFDDSLIAELTGALQEVDARAVVLSGEGKVFCAGGDLTWMQRSIDFTEEQNRADAEKLGEMFRAIDQCPCPVIAAVQGAAFGGGAGLVCASDIVVAEPDAKFCFSEVKLGLAPAVIARYAIAKMGVSAARRYFLTAEVFTATTAKELGLVHEVVPIDEMESRIETILASILANGPAAVAEAKRLIRAVSPANPVDAHSIAANTIARLRVSAEGQEGVRAFLEKRKPNWGGG